MPSATGVLRFALTAPVIDHIPESIIAGAVVEVISVDLYDIVDKSVIWQSDSVANKRYR